MSEARAAAAAPRRAGAALHPARSRTLGIIVTRNGGSICTGIGDVPPHVPVARGTTILRVTEGDQGMRIG